MPTSPGVDLESSEMVGLIFGSDKNASFLSVTLRQGNEEYRLGNLNVSKRVGTSDKILTMKMMRLPF